MKFCHAPLLVCAVCWGAAACNPASKGDGQSAARESSSETKPVEVKPKAQQRVFSVPVGPRLGIFPGRGIGPIRFGASLSTVERLMDSPCSEKTETLCRYAAHAVDFHFEDAKLTKIHIHGDERSFRTATTDSPDNTYGIFNGRFPQGAGLGMYSSYVISMLGEPSRKEAVGASPDAQTVERHHYPDMVLEYDKLKNGNVVLAGVVLSAPAAADRPAHGKPGKNPIQAAAAEKPAAVPSTASSR